MLGILNHSTKAIFICSARKLRNMTQNTPPQNAPSLSKKQEEQRAWLTELYQKRSPAGGFRAKDDGKIIYVAGWAMRCRDQGACIFVDLRDRSGLLQLVFDRSVLGDAFAEAEGMRSEYNVAVQGILRKRSAESYNSKLPTGEVEALVKDFRILSASLTPPISIEEYDHSSEELRLRYRVLDLRRQEMQEALRARSRLNHSIRNFLISQDFLEIETPVLNKATPEGARDFLVPSRIMPGNFYALPQSPQIFKQLLMLSGMERYFQIVKCFRDEDLRADRQPEFTQLDIEMSFVNRAMVMQSMEKLWAYVLEECFEVQLQLPIRGLSYHEAMENYGVDAPDLRYDMPLVDVAHIVKESQFQVFRKVLEEGGRVKALCVPGGAGLSRKEIENLEAWLAHDFQAKGLAWLKYEEQGLQSVISKFFQPALLEKLAHCLSCQKGDVIFFGAGPEEVVHSSLGHLRRRMAQERKLIPEKLWSFVWVYDFPLFMRDPQTNKIQSVHNPFTAPREEDFPVLMDEKAFADSGLSLLSQAYDLVLNGVEIGGGSVRIHDAKMQRQVFQYLALAPEQIEEQFSFLLRSLEYGAPPHAGIAFGLDRILMLFLQKNSIRDVIAFPKTQKGQCLMSQSPSKVEAEQLRELHLSSLHTDKTHYSSTSRRI